RGLRVVQEHFKPIVAQLVVKPFTLSKLKGLIGLGSFFSWHKYCWLLYLLRSWSLIKSCTLVGLNQRSRSMGKAKPPVMLSSSVSEKFPNSTSYPDTKPKKMSSPSNSV